MKLPWQRADLRKWNIVGMNHYRVGGRRMLYVAMTRAAYCITAEGDNEEGVFRDLAKQAARWNGSIDILEEIAT